MPEFVVAQAIAALAAILGSLLWIYRWIVIISVLLTWVNPDPRNPIVHFLYSVTDPVLSWIRRRFPFLVVGGLDLTPIVLIFAIVFAEWVVVGSLSELAYRIRATSPGSPYGR
jgi:YggT family protein